MSTYLVDSLVFFFFFFNDTATTEIYTLSLHDALPISLGPIGAALGVLLGHQFDEHGEELQAGPFAGEDVAAIGERFFRATFRVMGCIAKADGRVSELEISAARAVMGELRLDGPQVREAIAGFSAGKLPAFDLGGELAALRRACRGRPDLLRVFLEIQVRAALAGNGLEGPVRPLLGRIAAALGISPHELAHVEAVLRIQRGGPPPRGGRGGGAPARGPPLQEAHPGVATRAGASHAAG